MMKLRINDIVIFALFAALMFVSKIVMEFLPNIHLIGVFTIVLTVIYRWYALFPIYTFIMLIGLFNGFNTWWIPYLYIWTVLWAMVMALPKSLNSKAAAIIYPIVCALHGLLYGTLYAPVQALLYGFDFDTTLKWIVAGLPWDILHAFGNLAVGLLIFPLVKLIRKVNKTNI